MNRAEPSQRLESFVRDLTTALGYGTECSFIRIAGSRSEVYEVSLERDASLRFVVKESSPPEIAALRRFEEAGIKGVPRIVGVDTSVEPALLLMPRYRGTHGRFGDLHPRVVESLAQIHTHFAAQAISGGIEPLSLDVLFDWTFGDMSIYSRELRVKMGIIRDAVDVFKSLSTQFPRSLVHWDMHPDNVLIDCDDTIIIDWEHACVGPALVDLTNMVAWDSDCVRVYATAHEGYSGQVFDWDRKRQEFDWCRSITEIRYMSLPARAGDQASADGMANGVIGYLDRVA